MPNFIAEESSQRISNFTTKNNIISYDLNEILCSVEFYFRFILYQLISLISMYVKVTKN